MRLIRVCLVVACLAGSEAFFTSTPALASKVLPVCKSPLARQQRTGIIALQAQFFGAQKAETINGRKPPPSESSRRAAIAGEAKDERGNNVGDTRYTTSFDEDLSLEVEDLPAGTTEEFIRELALRLKNSGLPIDLRPDRITYKNAMVGTEVIDWMLKERIAKNRLAAIAYGRELVRKAEIVHVTKGHDFKDEPLFYRFVTPYEKGLINPKTPYQWFLRWATFPPLSFAVIFVFLAVANLPFFVPGAPDIFGVMPK